MASAYLTAELLAEPQESAELDVGIALRFFFETHWPLPVSRNVRTQERASG